MQIEAIKDELDPKGLIGESYRIEGIGEPECRAIFLDWALSLPVDADAQNLMRQLLQRYGENARGHPMTAILTEGVNAPTAHSARPRRGRGR